MGIAMALTLQILSHHSQCSGRWELESQTIPDVLDSPQYLQETGRWELPSETGGWELESQTHPDVLDSPQCLQVTGRWELEYFQIFSTYKS